MTGLTIDIEQLDTLIEKYNDAKAQADKWQAEYRAIAVKIAKKAAVKPGERSKFSSRHGDVSITGTINYSGDRELIQEIIDNYPHLLNEYIGAHYKLKVGAYDKADRDTKMLLDSVFVGKPGQPQIKVVD